MDILVGAFLFILGACVGSFLNVVVLRFGYSERGGARSACMACGSALGAFDLVPLFSYAALGGRCRTCGSGISIQYPIVEILTGLVFVLTYILITPLGPAQELMFVVTAGFWATMLALVTYDMRHTLIPIPFVWGLCGFAAIKVTITVALFASWAPALDAFLGALVAGGFFAAISIATRGRGMGIGDAYVAAAIGCMFGLEQAVVASVLAVWIGSLVGLALIALQWVFQRLTRRGLGARVTLTTEIPFAPFLAVGALLAWSLHLSLAALGLSL